MVGDNPTVFSKPRHHEDWSEKAYADYYNSKHTNFQLLHCNQAFHAFDFWMLDELNHTKPRLIELKSHPNKKSSDRYMVGCDLFKLQKLKSLALDSKAYVFHVFEDETLIQDVDTEIDEYKKYVYNGETKILGLIRYEHVLARIPIGLQHLRQKLDGLQSQVLTSKNPAPTAQTT